MDQDSQSIDSLYDFIYIDRGRLSAFMAQVFGDGVLTSLKKTEQTADGVNNGIEAGIPKFINGKSGTQSTNTSSHEMQFDSSWSLPLNVLDGLDEYGLIQHGLDEARIGDLRLANGKVSVLDIKLLQQMWEPMLEFQLMQERATLSTKQVGALKSSFKAIGSLVNKLPPSVQMYLSPDAGHGAWMTLNSDFMVINPDDLALKYGGMISGDWYVLGVVDALPEQDDVQPEIDHPLFPAMIGMLSGIRQAAGRPNDHYGMTPVLIFRKIDKR